MCMFYSLGGAADGLFDNQTPTHPYIMQIFELLTHANPPVHETTIQTSTYTSTHASIQMHIHSIQE